MHNFNATTFNNDENKFDCKKSDEAFMHDDF
jgi:hypothetical protein